MKNTREKVLQLSGIILGVMALAWKGTIGRVVPVQDYDRESGNKHERGMQFQKQDAVGLFRLSYVDCIPYSGPEQTIQIEEDGEVRCVEPREILPGVLEVGGASRLPRQRLGKLRSGSVLKGELEPEKGFVSAAARAGTRIVSLKIQVVHLPGGPPGVWIAVGAEDGHESWDEIYVRSEFAPSSGELS